MSKEGIEDPHTSLSSLSIFSLMRRDGKLRSGIGASQSVRTERTLCSIKAS